MDGRLTRLLFGGLAALTLPVVGCQSFAPKPPTGAQPAGSPAASALMQAGYKQPKPGLFAPPAEQPAPAPVRGKKGQPFKPETDIAIADVELEVAFDEKRSGEDRDKLLDVSRQRLQSALQKDPKNKDAHLKLAKLYTWAGDKERMVEMVRRVTTLYPKDKEVAFAQVRMMARFEDWAGACKGCEAALALDPENRTYKKTYGVVLARSNRWQEAMEAMMDVMGESDARTFLGRMLIDTGRVPEGQQQLEEALRVDPENAVARDHLASLQEYLQQAGGVK